MDVTIGTKLLLVFLADSPPGLATNLFNLTFVFEYFCALELESETIDVSFTSCRFSWNFLTALY